MKTVRLALSPALALTLASLALAACGGTVVFEEDGGDGGGGGLAVTSTNVASSGSSNGDGGGGVVTVGTAVSTVQSSSTGVPGCGSLLDELGGFTGECQACMEAACCAELAACDAGTDCHDCIFTGDCTEGAIADVEALFGTCYPQNCQAVCESGGCDPDEFRCVQSGECVDADWVCDGFVDCGDGTDEQDCRRCDIGFSTGDPGLDECLGEFCCDEFEACTGSGEDVDACVACLQSGGGPLCDDAIACYFESPCSGGEPDGICGTGLSTNEPDLDACLTAFCCDELDTCLAAGQDACVACFQQGGGPACDPFIGCAMDSCG